MNSSDIIVNSDLEETSHNPLQSGKKKKKKVKKMKKANVDDQGSSLSENLLE